jgi:ubiquinone/menaquinone biosynthesis C-methylase UbiE
MDRHDSKTAKNSESWDKYWLRAGHAAAYSGGGISHPLIESFWRDFFAAAAAQYESPKIIDIASGNGALIDCAASAFGGQLPDFTCLDISGAAIETLRAQFPAVHTVVADARKIPLDSAAYDIATSQFGIEYAGVAALTEVLRLLAPGGRMALLLHNRSGVIFRECETNRDAVERVQQAKFIPYAATMFEKGFAACHGADRAEYEAAARQFAPAIQSVESIMLRHGVHVAGDLITRLYDDVATMHENIQRYEPSDVLNWLDAMQDELQAFAGRMESMCQAAIDDETFDRLCTEIRDQGFSTIRADSLKASNQQLPLAWALVATRD